MVKPLIEKTNDYRTWWESLDKSDLIDVGSLTEKAWVAARAGMVPYSEETWTIPPVKEWPEDAEGFATCYFKKAKILSGNMREEQPYQFITLIPRPVEPWSPKKNDPVFFLNEDKVYVGQIKGDIKDMNGEIIGFSIFSNGYTICIKLKNIKPLDTSKVGLSWEKI